MAPRGTAVPDVGYYYEPIDWAINEVVHTNGIVTVAPGTVLAAYATAPGALGWLSGAGSQFVVEGTADQMVRIVTVDTVQEQSTANWSKQVYAPVYPWSDDDSPQPQYRFRFVKWDRLAADTPYHLYAQGSPPIVISIRDNQFYNGTLELDIGFHYVVTDANGVPVDTDGDGIPDYLEDANGNGVIDNNEGDPNNANDTGLRVVLTRPRKGINLP